MLDPKAVGRVLRDLRRAKGLTQEELSGLAALDRTHYSKIERGLRSPTIETLFKISYALELEPHKIMKAIEENVSFTFDP